jgi:hypothetical protein
MAPAINNILAFVILQVCFGGVFEMKTRPVTLRPGEVYNRVQEPIPLPHEVVERFKSSPMSITNYTVDLVRVVAGVEEPVPLTEIYNHHFLLYMGSASLMTGVYNALSAGDPLSGVTCNKSHSKLSSLRTMLPSAGVKELHRRMSLGIDQASDPVPAPNKTLPKTCKAFEGYAGLLYSGEPVVEEQTEDLGACCELATKNGGMMNYVQRNKTCSVVRDYTGTTECNPTDGCVLGFSPANSVDPYLGGATGGEFRNNPHKYPTPYAYEVPRPEFFTPVVHLINTRSPKDNTISPVGTASRNIECPCTPQRKIDLSNGTIDGCLPDIPFGCNDELTRQHNPGCALASYTGGYRCCKHGVFVADTTGIDIDTLPHDNVYFKFLFWYADADTDDDANTDLSANSRPTLRGATAREEDHPSSSSKKSEKVKQLHSTGCCDVTSTMDESSHQTEYTVPQCADPSSDCVHVATNVQPLDWFAGDSSGAPSDVLELVHAAAHLHTGGLMLELFDDETGQLLCRVKPTYGHSLTAPAVPGDEAGYLVGSAPCVWGPAPLKSPPRLRRDHLLRTVAYYNSTTRHDGVMALWLMAAHNTATPVATVSTTVSSADTLHPALDSTEQPKRAAVSSGKLVTCPTGAGDVKMGPRDWCILNCSTTLTYDINFGKNSFGVPNTGNVEIVTVDNYNRFLNNDPAFQYQNGSQVSKNVAKYGPVKIDGPIVIVQCQNAATSCGNVRIEAFACATNSKPALGTSAH